MTEHQYLITGQLHIPENNWCYDCSTSSKQAGSIHILDDRGVATVGSVEGCATCGTWEWTNHTTGVIKPLRPGHAGLRKDV